MRRLEILEPGLDHRTGHAQAFASALPEAAKARGIAYRIYGGERVPPDFAARYGVVPLFRHFDVPDPHRDLISGPLYRLTAQRRMMAEDLLGPAGPAAGADDVVVIPTAFPWLLLAVADWLRAVPASRRPRVVASFHEAGALFASDRPDLTLEAASLRLCVHSLQEVVPRQRLLFTATVAQLARRIAALIKLPVGLAPVANPVERYRSDVPADARRDAEGRPHVAIIGIPRTDKAPHGSLLPTALAIARRLPGARLFVQTWSTFDPAHDLPADGLAPGLEFHAGPLSDADYRAALLRSAVVVLPYESASYRARVSGIFVDAAAAGCTTVVPAGTWMARTIADGMASGTVFRQRDPGALAEAVADAVAALPERGATALAQSERWPRLVGVGPYLAAVERALGKIAGRAAAVAAPATGDAPDAADRRFILLDPRTRRFDEERTLLVTQLSAVAEGRSRRLLAYGRAGPDADATAAVTPLFRLLRLPRWAADRRAAPLARFIALARQWGDDLAGAGGPVVRSEDMVLVPDTEPAMLCALARWLGGVPGEDRPALVLHFARGPDAGERDPPSQPQAATSYALRMLTDVLPPARIHMTASTAAIADAVAAAGGIDCRVGPPPHPLDGLASAPPAAERRSRSGVPRIAVLATGIDAADTGPVPVAAAIRERLPRAPLIVQGGVDGNDRLTRAAAATLGATARQQIVGTAAAVVLVGGERPGRTVLAFVEAAAAGSLVIVPPGGMMAGEVADGNAVGVVARDAGAQAMAEAAVAALALDGESARAAAPRWRERYGVRAWIDAATAGLADGGRR